MKWIFIFILSSSFCFGQAWSGIISTARATDWTAAGLPGDIPTSVANSWTQSGSTISACGSSGTPVSPATCGITAALSGCGTNHYVLLGSGDFYLNASVAIPNNCVLRGGGANVTRVHFPNGGTYTGNVLVEIGTSDFFVGPCSLGVYWPCPAGDWNNQTAGTANWTAGYSQGASTITLDNVTGITTNLTPIVLDQCDTGYSGTASTEACTGVDGAVTTATIYAGGGGSGYAVNDTGTIGASYNSGAYFGNYPSATYKVTSVSSGVVTGISITAGGGGYTYTETTGNLGSPGYSATTATSGSGTGLKLVITAITSYDNGSILSCGVSMVCTYLAPSNTQRPARSQEEVFVATAISGSGPYTVTLDHALQHPNWASGQAPEAYWPQSGTATNCGVEDMEIDGSGITAGASSVAIVNAYKVWVYGIASNYSNAFHVAANYAENILIANSYFYWTTNAGVVSYGIGSETAVGHALFENNIMQGIVDPVNMDATCGGCVIAYNFMVNDYDTASSALFASLPQHSGSTDYILSEGNIGPAIYQDNSHGPHFMDTYFRNYLNGYESNNGTLPTQATVPVTVGAFSRYNNYLANVLGTAGYHTIGSCIPSSSSQHYCNDIGFPPSTQIWDLGFSDQGQIDFTNSPPEPNDTLVATTLYRFGNYDTVTGAVNWCGNSSNTNWTTVCSAGGGSCSGAGCVSQVPTGDPNYPNSIPSSQTFPASFYDGSTTAQTSCGTGLSFWKNPTSGTCPPYPSIGPDVTSGDIGMCTSGTYQWSRALTSGQCSGGTFTASVNGGYGNSNPAMRCYLNQMNGTPDGTGAFLTFNPSACYGSDSTGTTTVSGSVKLSGTVTIN